MNNTEEVPIRDAATVILLRKKKDCTYVLMGQRGNKAAFMPSKYVFPGGAVDEDDGNVPLFKSIDKKGIDLLNQYSKKKIAKELCVAAIRELWEEAGLRLCTKVDDVGTISPGWEEFCNDIYLPDASNLEYVFRAITPPGRPRRFDARFFICRAENVNGSLDDFSSASTELSHLHWIDINEVKSLNLPFITEVVLNEVKEIIKDGPNKKGVPFFKHGASSDFIFIS
jgi:8-oxo-dGTP pyrophosphatase MutT (NUDIX family)